MGTECGVANFLCAGLGERALPALKPHWEQNGDDTGLLQLGHSFGGGAVLGFEGGGGMASESGAEVPQLEQNFFTSGAPQFVQGFKVGSGLEASWDSFRRGLGVEGGGGTPVICCLGGGMGHSDPQFVQNLLVFGVPQLGQVLIGVLAACGSELSCRRGLGVEGGGGTELIFGLPLGGGGGAHSDPQLVQNLLEVRAPH